jgi:hypothetical protein
MKMESATYTDAFYDAVIGEYFELERAELIRRIRRIVEETEALVPGLEGFTATDEQDWNPLETLAHMTGAAQFFGWLIYQVAKQREVPGNVLDFLNLRDPTMAEALPSGAAALGQQLREAADRTIGFLETVPYEELRNSIPFASRRLSAEDFTRISLINHLEDHLEQLRAGLPAR